MPVSPEEYLAKRRKVVYLESTHEEFVLRKFPRQTVYLLLEQFGVVVSTNTEVDELEAELRDRVSELDMVKELPAILEIVLPAGIAEPQVVVSKKPGDMTVLELDDIEPKDQIELFGYIMDYNGFSEKAVEERESFQPPGTE